MTATVTDLNQAAGAVKEQVIAWRRYLHEHPELSFHEEKTAQFVYETLLSFGNLEVSRPTKNSVMARLIGSLSVRAGKSAGDARGHGRAPDHGRKQL